MSEYCLANGGLGDGPIGEACCENIFHLSAKGALERVSLPPCLAEGEGLLMYSGEFRIDPVEICIEFSKAENAREWLEALVLRHVQRVRQADGIFAAAQIKEANS